VSGLDGGKLLESEGSSARSRAQDRLEAQTDRGGNDPETPLAYPADMIGKRIGPRGA
jgi:hypothetical protein